MRLYNVKFFQGVFKSLGQNATFSYNVYNSNFFERFEKSITEDDKHESTYNLTKNIDLKS